MPSERFDYSGQGYQLLGDTLAEHVALSPAQAVEQSAMKPLPMADSRFAATMIDQRQRHQSAWLRDCRGLRIHQ